jgi:hypothetical protein
MENQSWEKYSKEALNRLRMLEAMANTALKKARREIRNLLENKEPNMKATEFTNLMFAVSQVVEFPEFKEYKG